MKFKCPLIVVEDMGRSRAFYEQVLGQKVILDFGANITFSGDFSLQSKESWRGFIGKDEDTIMFRSNNFELYFEEKKFDTFLERLKAYDVKLLHPAKEYPWGQNVVRFYDPDLHIIEVGESMVSVVKRFAAGGMSAEEISKRTQHPMEFVERALKEKIQKKLKSIKGKQ